MSLKKYLLIIVLMWSQPAMPCSVFYFESLNRHWVAKNTDSVPDKGFVFVNYRGAVKTQNKIKFGARAEWVSKYGSLSMGMHGREYSFEGMNEKGLVIGILQLEESQPPPAGDKPYVGETEWVQYMLDNAATLDEVVTLTHTVVPKKFYSGVHYFVCDAGGGCAVIQYVNEEKRIYRDFSLPTPSLTNRTYDYSLRFLAEHLGFGGQRPIPEGYQTENRFVRLNAAIQAHDWIRNINPREFGFKVLDSAKQFPSDPWPTWHQSLFDIGDRKIIFRSKHSAGDQIINLADFSFECNERGEMIDLRVSHQGNAKEIAEPFDAEKVLDVSVENAHHYQPWVPRFMVKRQAYSEIKCAR